jgi:hypothetical protein
MVRMLNPAEIRRRLAESAQAAFRRDAEALAATEAWLTSAPAREWPRIDAYARTWRVAGPTLGDSENWTAAVLAQPSPVAAVLASMHYDGYVRERAMTALSASQHELSDLALAVRVTDHVPVIREAAARAVLARTSLAQAERIMPVLHRLERRERARMSDRVTFARSSPRMATWRSGRAFGRPTTATSGARRTGTASRPASSASRTPFGRCPARVTRSSAARSRA